MGPRSYAARTLTEFLLDHGGLEDQCFELTRGTSVSLWGYIADTRYRIHELQLSPYDTVVLWAAALVIARRLNKERERSKNKRLGLASSSRLLNAADVAPLALARASSCLATLLVASSLLGDDPTEQSIYRPQMLGRELLAKYLFASSLWLSFASILIVAVSAAWSLLDPRTTMTTPANNNVRTRTRRTKRTKTTWRDGLAKARANARIAALPTSVVAVLYLAYVHLPLFRHSLHGEVDLGLPSGLSLVLSQAVSSFVAFCVFFKLLPKPEPSVVPEAVGTRKTKKYATDPKVVKRMGVLAKEAKERLQALKSGERVLRRTYSEGNFGNFKPASPSATAAMTRPSAPLTPPRRRASERLPARRKSPTRRQSKLAPLLEHGEESKGDGPPPPPTRMSSERLPARRRSMPATLPERKEEHEEESKEGGPPSPQWAKYSTIGRATYPSYSPDSPLMDIHLAGPTLSSADLLAKLKSSKSISVKTDIDIQRSSPERGSSAPRLAGVERGSSERGSSVSHLADVDVRDKCSTLGGTASPNGPPVDFRLASISIKRTLSVPIGIERGSSVPRLVDNDALAKHSSLGGVGVQRSLSVPLLADEDMSY